MLRVNTFFTSIILITSAVIFSGCASMSGIEAEENLKQLSVGQTQAKVLALLGTPDSVVRPKETREPTRWIYHFKNDLRKGQHLYVSFQRGLVREFGEIQSREIASAEPDTMSGTCTRRPHNDFFEQSLCTHK